MNEMHNEIHQVRSSNRKVMMAAAGLAAVSVAVSGAAGALTGSSALAATDDQPQTTQALEEEQKTPEEPTTPKNPVKAAKQYAKQLSKEKYHWNNDQFQALVMLWNKESNWKVTEENPSSGAYGIPQSLPGKKMASAGKDWKTNYETQIKWGLKYIKQTYGSPSAAWAHSQATNWY